MTTVLRLVPDDGDEHAPATIDEASTACRALLADLAEAWADAMDVGAPRPLLRGQEATVWTIDHLVDQSRRLRDAAVRVADAADRLDALVGQVRQGRVRP